MSRTCALYQAGLVGYGRGLQIQQEAWKAVAAGRWDGVLILVEHPAVITIGRGDDTEGLLFSYEDYARRGIEVHPCDRGGKTTCHNPGQLVGYPVLNLARWRKDVHWYLRALEQVMIESLRCYGLSAGRRPEYTGAWLGDKKIAAIGVAVRQWITRHGFALNVNNDLSLFRTIVPCGIREFGVTSLHEAGVPAASVADAAARVVDKFRDIFAANVCPITSLLGDDSKS